MKGLKNKQFIKEEFARVSYLTDDYSLEVLNYLRKSCPGFGEDTYYVGLDQIVFGGLCVPESDLAKKFLDLFDYEHRVTVVDGRRRLFNHFHRSRRLLTFTLKIVESMVKQKITKKCESGQRSLVALEAFLGRSIDSLRSANVLFAEGLTHDANLCLRAGFESILKFYYCVADERRIESLEFSSLCGLLEMLYMYRDSLTRQGLNTNSIESNIAIEEAKMESFGGRRYLERGKTKWSAPCGKDNGDWTLMALDAPLFGRDEGLSDSLNDEQVRTLHGEFMLQGHASAHCLSIIWDSYCRVEDGKLKSYINKYQPCNNVPFNIYEMLFLVIEALGVMRGVPDTPYGVFVASLIPSQHNEKCHELGWVEPI